MARSRNIKPGFFSNDELAECEPLARLLFAGLWTEADREGRLEDRPKKLKAAILPYDNCDADTLLGQLATRGFIVRYQVEGSGFIQIVSFGKHQDPHYKEKASEIPAPPGHVDTGKTGGAPSEELRAKIIARDGACKHCQSTVDLTLDHIIPRSNGGTHDEDNLQTLCRRCNSGKNNRQARPTISRASADDQGGESPLIPDSLIPSSLIPDSRIPDSSISATPLPGKPARKRAVKPPAPSAEAWDAYAMAYAIKYGCDPVRNASVNAQLALVVGKLGAEESPSVAAFFVSHQNGLYVSAMHPVSLLLRDAEKLRTEWATGRQVTRTQGQQADRTQTNANAFAPLLAAAKENGSWLVVN